MKNDAPAAPISRRLVIRLTYILSKHDPCLARVERFGQNQPTEGSISHADDFPEALPNFIGLQIVLIETWEARLLHPESNPTIFRPRQHITALRGTIREGRKVGWRERFFGEAPYGLYVDCHFDERGGVSATTSLGVELYVEGPAVQSPAPRPATKDEARKILRVLTREKERELDAWVHVKDSVTFEKWKITGSDSDKPLGPSCLVRLEVSSKSKELLVIWFSNNDPFELFPRLDQRIAKGAIQSFRASDEGGYRLTIPDGETGFTLKHKPVVEGCLVVAKSDASIDLEQVKGSMLCFFAGNPFACFHLDSGPRKRFFEGRGEMDPVEHGLGMVPAGRQWNSDTFRGVLPKGASAVLITMPVKSLA